MVGDILFYYKKKIITSGTRLDYQVMLEYVKHYRRNDRDLDSFSAMQEDTGYVTNTTDTCMRE